MGLYLATNLRISGEGAGGTVGEVGEFDLEKLVIGVLTSRPDQSDFLLATLTELFGEIDYRSAEIPFVFTHYYDREMGTPILRYFLSFSALTPPEQLAAIKLQTNLVETRFAEEGRRRVNLDPGLLCLDRFVLASTKDNGRRIPLQSGIYAEITLIYAHGEYRPVDWTYPDFASRSHRDILAEIRGIYRDQLKQKPK